MCSKLCHQSIRKISMFRSLAAKNYYECLEIRPGATQAEIKEAYYSLSMKYHPDRNKGEEASIRFREITEAYEALRNIRVRKLYDKGLTMRTGPNVMEDEEINKFYQSRQTRSRPPPPTGRTPFYDFDEWSKSHYGATLARDIARKKRRQAEESERRDKVEEAKKEKVLFSIFIMACFMVYILARHEDYDVVKGNMDKTQR